jgi:hypothetical protein
LLFATAQTYTTEEQRNRMYHRLAEQCRMPAPRHSSPDGYIILPVSCRRRQCCWYFQMAIYPRTIRRKLVERVLIHWVAIRCCAGAATSRSNRSSNQSYYADFSRAIEQPHSFRCFEMSNCPRQSRSNKTSVYGTCFVKDLLVVFATLLCGSVAHLMLYPVELLQISV